jgi:peptide/nickel transport system substrate-binding protein
MMNLGRHRLRLAGVAAVAAVALLAAGCGASSGGSKASAGSTGKAVKGGIATVALPPATTPNWIFPFMSLTYFSVYNSQDFQYLMYRPLYMFGGESTQPTVNYPLSPASAPVYSDGGKTVTINLKGWKWSNGETVDAKDVVFWLNMMNAEIANWAGASPGGIPANITKYSATGPNTVTLHLNGKYSSYWYTYNELSQITPMPMAWDVTSTSAAPGSGGCTTDTAADKWAKCKAVYNFLTAQSKGTSTYTTSKLWTVVNGPWKLSAFNTNGNDAFVPNPKYSGSPKPQLAEVKFVPYTDDSSEYTALKAGTSALDVGYIPSADLPVKPVSQALPSNNPLGSNFTLSPAYTFGVDYYQINLNNNTYGPVFKQLYFRQVLEYLDDQAGMASSIYRGYGYPTTGPAPTKPSNPWVPTIQQGNGPYPFSVAKAKSLLAAHGWALQGGVQTCTDAAKCGAGVTAGTKLKLNMDYASGVTVFTQEAEIYKSDLAKAGIDLTIASQSFNTILGEAVPCTGSKCTWQFAMYGGWVYSPDYLPTGEELFQTGAGSNGGSYSNPTMDQLIKETTSQSSVSVYHNFATFAAKQLPFVWMPNSYNVWGVTSKLHNVTFNPLDTFVPEYWYFTK